MSRIATTFSAAGAATLLVIASFSAGTATRSSGDDAPTVAAVAAAAAPIHAAAATPPSDDTRDELLSPAAIPSTLEMQYVPIQPCRIVDTRSTGAGAFPAQAKRDFNVSGTLGFVPQGGKSGGCGIPAGAQAISATVAAIDATAIGYLRAWPAGTSEPQASVLQYPLGRSSTGATLTIKSGAAPHLSVKNWNGATQVVIDVFGYYMPQMWAYIGSSGPAIDQSGRLVSSTKTGTGTYTLVWDRDISTCAGVANSDISGYVTAVYTSGSTSYVYVYSNTTGNAADYWFNVAIHC